MPRRVILFIFALFSPRTVRCSTSLVMTAYHPFCAGTMVLATSGTGWTREMFVLNDGIVVRTFRALIAEVQAICQWRQSQWCDWRLMTQATAPSS